MTEAPKRIRIDPDYDGWEDQIVGWSADRRDDQGRYHAPLDWPEYILASEHERIVAEKGTEIARLTTERDAIAALRARAEANVEKLAVALANLIGYIDTRIGWNISSPPSTTTSSRRRTPKSPA